ncbi:23S rRNA (pseudouridine(1915)-N(3))-methyltransferase RlmH [Prochlorococcus sp. MIT 1223]|uniref:23S rRNA (pseudouridine(1915)-N(3))-methyltransferase RlmH n=1 Tax=Prochlorococcus sp. MIT 1223 TaxID=3096217 RepID=UPI002A751209|nr:23S rRNA (pseudouridine(1915)-N(3))-methyltransferase RlmH [Prochlorococcus sp. MIT 1223]
MLNTSRYRIIAVGKVSKTWIQQGINLYIKRIPGLTINEIKNSNPIKEGKLILKSIKKGELVVILGEEFKAMSSLQFANSLNANSNQRIVFIVGGADGISPEVKDIASLKISLSPLTFPHELARLLLIEQIYRAQTILQGTPYHRT